MNSGKSQLYFDTDGFLFIRKPEGSSIHVRLSESLLCAASYLEGGRYIAGIYVSETGSNETLMYVDILSLTQPWSVQRWLIGPNGVCAQHEDLDPVVDQPIQSNYILSPRIIDILREKLNDLEIYAFLKLLCGRNVAAEYFNSCVANHRSVSGSPSRLVVVFNHHFIRNCKLLHEFYSDRFPEIDFVLPCIAPDHPNYLAYPFGSYQFHGLICCYLRDRMLSGNLGDQNYLFIQDDVLLHPRVTDEEISRLLSDEHGAWFPFNWRYALDNGKWKWAQRIKNSVSRQRDFEAGNGFEGLASMMSPRHLYHGVSDCFALRATIIPEFVDRLAPFVAANLFPELAIPTALFNTASASGMTVAPPTGTLLWREKRALVNDREFITSFLNSDAAFLHPVKIADGGCAALQCVREWIAGTPGV